VTGSARFHRYLRIIAFAACLAEAGAASAEVSVSPRASIDVEYNSNIFSVAPGSPELVAQGDLQRSDTTLNYAAGLTVDGKWGLQQLTANFQGSEIDYVHYTDLDHSEYLGDVAFIWKSNGPFDGKLDVQRNHVMAPFKDTNTTELEVDTIQQFTGTLNVHVLNDFRLESTYSNTDSKTPVPGYPEASVNENTEKVAFLYAGTANLSYGVGGAELEGKYSNSVNPTTYRQSTADIAVDYAVGAFSKINAWLGYSDRTYSSTAQSNSAITGSLEFLRQLTGKTSISVDLSRAINNYVVGGGSEIDTSATLGVNWAATAKITVTAHIAETHSDFGQQSPTITTDAGRVDNFRTASMSLDYQVLRWLTLRAYGQYQSRDSNLYQYIYNASIVGLQMKGQF